MIKFELCSAGTPAQIGRFYQEVFGARVESPKSSECLVYVGPGCKLRFTEDPALKHVADKVTSSPVASP